MATADFAAQMDSAENRERVFWLQGRSVVLGSVARLAEEFLEHHSGAVTAFRQHRRVKDAARGELIMGVARHFFCDCTGGSPFFSTDYVQLKGGALDEFRTRHREQVLARMTETSISRTVFDCLGNALRTRRLIAIEGPPGFGKTFPLKCWSDLHLGRSRYLRLRGITNRPSFFATVLESLGFTHIKHSGADKLQRMLQHFLRASHLMLIIAEAQNLLPSKEFSWKRPELLDWIAGGTFDQQIPCALLTWADFATRRAAAAQSTNWRAEHLGRRLHYTRLKTPPTEADFRAVAKAMLPDASAESLDLIAGYAIGSKHFMQAVVDVITDARDLAETSGRKKVTFADVDKAITQRTESDAAQVEALSSPVGRPRSHADHPGGTRVNTIAETRRLVDDLKRDPALVEWQPPSEATGVYISGAGAATSDSIAARLSNGEHVMRADAVRNLGVPFLDSLNQRSISLAKNVHAGIFVAASRSITAPITSEQDFGSGAAGTPQVNVQGHTMVVVRPIRIA